MSSETYEYLNIGLFLITKKNVFYKIWYKTVICNIVEVRRRQQAVEIF